jgi:hypothetical protein
VVAEIKDKLRVVLVKPGRRGLRLHVGKRSRFRQRHGLQSITLTLFFYKNIYLKVIYVYFYESIFQDKSIHIVFTFPNLTT